LESVKGELESLLEIAIHDKTKAILQNEIIKINNEIAALNRLLAKANAPSSDQPRKMVVNINVR
jgi:hypothetical protein